MAILTKPSSAARTSLIYITVGALMDVWTTVYFWYLREHPPEDGSNARYYWCAGFFITGLVLLVIGLAVGQIGRSARHAELPPEEVTPAAARAEVEAAARAPVVAPVAPVAPGVVPTNGAAHVPAQPVVAAAQVAAAPPQSAVTVVKHETVPAGRG